MPILLMSANADPCRSMPIPSKNADSCRCQCRLISTSLVTTNQHSYCLHLRCLVLKFYILKITVVPVWIFCLNFNSVFVNVCFITLWNKNDEFPIKLGFYSKTIPLLSGIHAWNNYLLELIMVHHLLLPGHLSNQLGSVTQRRRRLALWRR